MMGPETPSSVDLPSEALEPLPLSASSSSFNSVYRGSITGDALLFPSTSSSFVDPPSYADAVFRPHQPQNGSDSFSRNALTYSRSGPASTSDYVEITVSDPQKENDAATSLVPGGGSHVTYLINTRTRSAAAAYSVRRRFRDFVVLADRLAESYRGFFIPIRPDKNVVESQVMQKHEFVEQRRADLEKYLQHLAAHPAIGRSEELRVFLQSQGKLPLAPTTDVASRMLDGAVKLPKQLFGDGVSGCVPPQEAVQPARGGRDLLRMFKELKQSVTNGWGGVKPMAVEEDKEFLERKENIQELTLQLNAASEQAESLVKAQHDTGEVMGELGLAFIKLLKLENDESIYDSQKVGAADIKTIATAAVKASRFYRELNSQTIKHLQEILHEYIGLMLIIRLAFSERSDALLTVQTLLSDIASWRTRVDKLEVASSRIFGGDESRIRRLEEIRKTISVTEDAKDCAVREYERIKERNRFELERFDKERRDDFESMLRGLAINQAGYFEKIANVWDAVANETSHYAKDNC
ncbi:Sorting nexin 2B [Apostasia shenzhenica]|uniref:Sorting nexin 2B n=1 Tax=Apostasia shenzhenica TaxID=1088818 RepID=A0A2I0BGF5_9ASPA|nr:Sorting nexin 2B [Apostasia shenzhenica]